MKVYFWFFILQIAYGGPISSGFVGDWVGNVVNSNVRTPGRLTWRIAMTKDLLTISESFQGENVEIPPQIISYNRDGTRTEGYVGSVPVWMSIDLLRQHWLKINSANEVELTKVHTSGYVEVDTLTLSKDDLKVVRRLGAKNQLIYSFHRSKER